MLRPHVRSSPCKTFHLVDDITVTQPFTDKARTQAQTWATTGTFAPYLMVWRQPAAGTACWPGPVGRGTCRRWISWWHRWLFQVQVSLVKEAIPEGAPDEGRCRRNPGRDIKDSHGDVQRRERDSLEEKKRSDQAAEQWYCTCQRATGQQKCCKS